MKWAKKYNTDIKRVHDLNQAGYSLPEIIKILNLSIPRTTLNRYLRSAGFEIILRRKDINKRTGKIAISRKTEYASSDAWKNALIRKFGHRCIVPGCGYTLIVEAHHRVFSSAGGRMTVANGVLLCPNHHAEAHAGILDVTEALKKSGELLEKQETVNQQPSLINSPFMRILKYEEGSETNSQAKAVMETRAPEAGNYGRRKLIDERLLEVSGQDIVRPADIIN